jgi:hypothetical protein
MSDYIVDPASEAEWVIEAFLDALGREEATSQLIGQLRNRLDAEYARLEEKYEHWLIDAPARYALRQSVVVLTAYRHYEETVPRSALLSILGRSFTEPLRQPVLTGTARTLDESDDPFTQLVGISKARERQAFGASFQFERRRDDAFGYYLDIVRCLWHSFFTAEGYPELTGLFCAFDNNWSEAIDPDKHGVRFERVTTLATGGSLCPFHFFRVSRR